MDVDMKPQQTEIDMLELQVWLEVRLQQPRPQQPLDHLGNLKWPQEPQDQPLK